MQRQLLSYFSSYFLDLSFIFSLSSQKWIWPAISKSFKKDFQILMKKTLKFKIQIFLYPLPFLPSVNKRKIHSPTGERTDHPTGEDQAIPHPGPRL